MNARIRLAVLTFTLSVNVHATEAINQADRESVAANESTRSLVAAVQAGDIEQAEKHLADGADVDVRAQTASRRYT